MADRHHEVTRLEGFSDAVFGFALTLLVVSLEVPSDFEALKAQMQGFLGFALMFAMVCWIWYEHNWFFRHTGLQDVVMIFGTFLLLYRHARSVTGSLSPSDAVDMRFASRAHAISALLVQGARAKEQVVAA